MVSIVEVLKEQNEWQNIVDQIRNHYTKQKESPQQWFTVDFGELEEKDLNLLEKYLIKEIIK